MSTQNPISKKIVFSNEGKIKTFLYEVKQKKISLEISLEISSLEGWLKEVL